MGVLGTIGASLLPALDFSGASASSSYSPTMLAGELTQGLCWVVQDLEVIMKDRSLNIIFPNGLADLLGIELLEF